MDIIAKLATSLNRRDEVPNQELAAEIVKRGEWDDVNDLIANLLNLNKGIRYDCIKVLYEIGYLEPGLIAEFLSIFLDLIGGKDNRLQWGSMTAIACIVRVRPDDVCESLPKIIRVANRGSVITRDQCVKILITLCSIGKHADTAFPLLLKLMAKCPTNQLPMYAENAIPVVTADGRDEFIQVLTSRLGEVESLSKQKRIEKVIAQLSK